MRGSVLSVVLGLLSANPVLATYHFIHIELVVVGVNGDPEARAVQLRMREVRQSEAGRSRPFVVDAAGQCKLLLIDIEAPVDGGEIGDRVRILPRRLLDRTAGGADGDGDGHGDGQGAGDDSQDDNLNDTSLDPPADGVSGVRCGSGASVVIPAAFSLS